jgi:hypothetical protein
MSISPCLWKTGYLAFKNAAVPSGPYLNFSTPEAMKIKANNTLPTIVPKLILSQKI